MFSFFRRQVKAESRDLEQVIFDVAEHQRDEDFHILYRLMATRHVLVPVDPATLPAGAVPGEKYQVGSNDRVLMAYVKGPKDLRFCIGATVDGLPILRNGYVGMAWHDFLGMTLKCDDSIFGALLQGKTSWVAFGRERIRYILDLGPGA